jgi:hypothetical protein
MAARGSKGGHLGLGNTGIDALQYRPEDADFARYLHSRRNTEAGEGDEYEGDGSSTGAFRVPDYSGLVEDEGEDDAGEGKRSRHLQTATSSVSGSGRTSTGTPAESQAVRFSHIQQPGGAGNGHLLAGGHSTGDVVRVCLTDEDSQLPPPTPGSVASGRISRVGGVFFTALRRSFAEDEDDTASMLSARWVELATEGKP